MPVDDTTLGEELNAFADGLLALVLETEDLQQKKKLRRQLTDTHKIIAKLVEAHVKDATAEYEAATTGIEGANKAIQKATADLGKTADAIDKIAKGLDFLAKLLKALGIALA